MKKIKFMIILTLIVLALTSCKLMTREDNKVNEDAENKDVKQDEVDSDIDEIKVKVDSMSVDEKIGQLIIAGFEGQQINAGVKSLITRYKVGGFILFARNINDAEQTKTLLNELKYENSNNDYPLFLSIDEEGGRVSRLPSEYKTLPTALEVGNLDKEELALKLGQILGDRVKSMGFNLNFAPILDIYSNPENTVIGNRAFGKDVDQVKDNGINVMEGMRNTGIIPTVKHFPGHGDTSIDSHLTLPKIEKTFEELRSFELKPFEYAIKKDAEMIMVAHILYPYIDEIYPSSISSQIIGNILRKELGYGGVVISDDMTMGAILKNYTIEEATLKFLKAGGDIALICHGEENTINSINRIKKGLEENELSEEELDSKVYRVLKLKKKYKLEDKIVDSVDLEELDSETLNFLEKFK